MGRHDFAPGEGVRIIGFRHVRRAERGAAALVITLMLGCGSLLGVGAIVVDVGQIYAEREELQSGADAAALAVGKACTVTPSTCAAQAAATAQRYADGNAKDGTSWVPTIYGRATGLLSCPSSSGRLSACQGTAPTTAGYVEVRTVTRRPDGTTLLPSTFARTLAGGSFDGKQVAACARVAWAPPASSPVYALTISTCEWNSMTASGTNLQPNPPAIPPASAESTIRLHGDGATTCAAGSAGWDAPGGFGWLAGANCQTIVGPGGTYAGDSGNGVSWDCFNAMAAYRTNHTVVLIPIYDGVRGTGGNITYHAVGIAAFVITGYNITGAWASSWLTGQQWCSGNTKCIYGYFTGRYLFGNGNTGALSYGVSVLRTVG